MTLQQSIVLALQASIFMTVFDFGLQATFDDVLYVVRRPSLLVRSLVAMFVIMPVVAVTLAETFTFLESIEAALLALSISPIPPLLPGKEQDAGGETSYGLGLMAIAAGLSIVILPLTLQLFGLYFGRSFAMSSGAIARVVLTSGDPSAGGRSGATRHRPATGPASQEAGWPGREHGAGNRGTRTSGRRASSGARTGGQRHHRRPCRLCGGWPRRRALARGPTRRREAGARTINGQPASGDCAGRGRSAGEPRREHRVVPAGERARRVPVSGMAEASGACLRDLIGEVRKLQVRARTFSLRGLRLPPAPSRKPPPVRRPGGTAVASLGDCEARCRPPGGGSSPQIPDDRRTLDTP